jgi:hypothetical protein
MKLLGIIFGTLGCICLYLSHSNQSILQRQLPLMVRYSGWGVLVISLICLTVSLSILVGILVWLAIITVAWSFLPFITLFKKYQPDESAK